MAIVITYLTEDGSNEQEEFYGYIPEMDLSYRDIVDIDLSPLSSYTDLLRLNLGHNKIKKIDLTPLSSCTGIKYLQLHDNQLEAIDLTPLSSLPNLVSLKLSENQLQSIDLIPLVSCTSFLQELHIDCNEIKSIDLSPLSPRFSDKEIYIDTEVRTHSWLKRRIGVYERPTNIYPWSLLHQIVTWYGTDRRVQQDILMALGLKRYGFIDSDLKDLLLSIEPETPTQDAQEFVRRNIVNSIASGVDNNGTTTGLKLEELATEHEEIAVRSQHIIKLRESEMEKTVVAKRNGELDLGGLWLTAYGYEILMSLDIHLTADLYELAKIKKTFRKLGFELKTSETSERRASGVKMSNELKEAIWWIAENRSRSWRDINESED